VAVLAEPLTIAEKAVRLYVAVQQRLPWTRQLEDAALYEGKRAIVLGAGPIGLLGCMLLLERGCRVWVYSREPQSDARAVLVDSIGAHYVCSGDVPLADLAMDIGGADLIYEATGAPALLAEATQHLAPNGVLLLAGLSPDDRRIETPMAAIVRELVINNQVILGTVNANAADFEAAIRDLGAFSHAWPDALRGLITGRHPLEDFCHCALDRRGIKEVIRVWDDD
jgi:glucose 1-dehydrogenase